MKAKTISGDIITVIPKQYDGYVGYIEPSTGYYYDSENLTIVSFDDDFNPDYWTRLEHTYVGMFMKSFLDNFDGTATMEQLSDDAIALAHALVQKLKEKEERK